MMIANRSRSDGTGVYVREEEGKIVGAVIGLVGSKKLLGGKKIATTLHPKVIFECYLELGEPRKSGKELLDETVLACQRAQSEARAEARAEVQEKP